MIVHADEYHSRASLSDGDEFISRPPDVPPEFREALLSSAICARCFLFSKSNPRPRATVAFASEDGRRAKGARSSSWAAS